MSLKNLKNAFIEIFSDEGLKIKEEYNAEYSLNELRRFEYQF